MSKTTTARSTVSSNASLLEKQLTLASWFSSSLGYENSASMLQSLKVAGEGWGDQYNKVLERWRTEEKSDKAPYREILPRLDESIRTDWEAISRNRGGNLSLKYFQYLALLASELFLHLLANKPKTLLKELQQHASANDHLQDIPDLSALHKLAFWMATGSGKTLLMHMHYRQFLRYQRQLFVPNNVLLVTPNEELSRQHIGEMEESGIPCFHHVEMDDSSHSESDEPPVRVIEITKLVLEQSKRGKGKGDSVPVESFSGRNLVFVDEGHKGAGGEAWFLLRDKLANSGDKGGFVFEYSATFGQALTASLLAKPRPNSENAAREYDRAQEYARSILFNYSYRYFHGDGYGKEFSIRGISADPADAKSERLIMLGNLLAFFEQQLVYEDHRSALAQYDIEKPLLLLLGRTVSNATDPDVIKIILFLADVAADRDVRGHAWLEKAAAKMLAGKSGLRDGKGNDLFTGHFDVLREKFPNGEGLPAQLLKTFFRTSASGPLRISLLKQTKDEIALRVGLCTPFALVYVGDTKGVSDLATDKRVQVNTDSVRPSLFAGVHLDDSPINVLIGAKKFMEGWSSWRVSSIGLLNLGQTEGTEIIQLFGRGVRLKGENLSLKRSTAEVRKEMGEKAGDALKLLETLNIFAIRAAFMNQFREYLEAESVLKKVFPLDIVFNTDMAKGKELKYLHFPHASKFREIVELAYRKGIAVKLDYSVKTVTIRSGGGRAQFLFGNHKDDGEYFPEELTSLLDLNALYMRLLDYKYQQRHTTLIIQRDELKRILQCGCRIIGADDIFDVRSMSDLRRLQDVAFAALCQYGTSLYFHEQKKWEKKNVSLVPLLDKQQQPSGDVRKSFMNYEIHVRQDDVELLEKVEKLLKDEKLLWQSDSESGYDGLKWVFFNRHLYLPLLVNDDNDAITTTPRGLEKSERNFVVKLREYLNSPADKTHLQGKEIFLLRNGGRGKGIGFYEDEGFFPDFILWIKSRKAQRVVFVEPHGMRHAAAYSEYPKARLWETLREITGKLQKERGNKHISLDSYIVSQTGYEDLKNLYPGWNKKKFTQCHILFAEDGEEYIKAILAGDGKRRGKGD